MMVGMPSCSPRPGVAGDGPGVRVGACVSYRFVSRVTFVAGGAPDPPTATQRNENESPRTPGSSPAMPGERRKTTTNNYGTQPPMRPLSYLPFVALPGLFALVALCRGDGGGFPPDEAAKRMRPADGLAVKLFAAEPD